MDQSRNLHITLRAISCLSSWLLIQVAALFLAAPAHTQTVKGFLSTDSVTVGERFRLSLVVEHDPSIHPIFPSAPSDSAFGDLILIDRLGEDIPFTRTNSAGLQVDSVVYEVTTFALDTAYVDPIPVTFTAGERTLTASTQPLLIGVRSLVGPNDQDIKDLAPLTEFPRGVWFGITLLLIALFITALLVWIWRRRRKVSQPIADHQVSAVSDVSPYEEALQRLKELEQVDLTQSAAVKPFYVSLSDLLRIYLEKRLQVPALETTTRELTQLLHSKQRMLDVNQEAIQKIKSVLDLSDLVKFADFIPHARYGQDSLRSSYDILQSIEEIRRARSVPEPVATPATTAE